MYSFTNHFSRSVLYQRIGMMNRRPSGVTAWGRYVLWIGVLGGMVLACRHRIHEDDMAISKAPKHRNFPAISPTRALVIALENKGDWYRHLAVYNGKFGTEILRNNPVVLQVKGDKLVLSDDIKYSSAVYVDGQKVPSETLGQLSPEFVSELFVLHQSAPSANTNTRDKPYQIMVQTSPQPILFDQKREKFFTLLQASVHSQHPFGIVYSFSMNELLEATFFHNKNTLVERTDNEHLKVYDEFKNDVDVFINNLSATPADVATIHVREVARLYTKERPYTDWFRAKQPLSRFVLNIQTAPKRANRDSSYYVFSPFYSGDF